MSMAANAETRRGPRGRLGLAVMALAGLVFVGSLAMKPAQIETTDPLAVAVEPLVQAVEAAPAQDGATATGEIAVAAIEGAADAAQEASPIDWAMVGSALTFVLTALGALSTLIFTWRSDRRYERLTELRARELELEIDRLRAAGAA
ncbi:MAG: hypothetical protein EBS42_07620 [Caulobacteraceae bacterium]|nr:hypothetical protein [Caulobacteraceae bacterium]